MISAGRVENRAAKTDAIVQKAFAEIMSTGKLNATTAKKLEGLGFSVDNIQAEFKEKYGNGGFQVNAMFRPDASKDDVKEIPGDTARVHAAANFLDQAVAQKDMNGAGGALAKVIDQIA